MAVWVQYLIALAALLALAPLVARFGRRFGSKAKGGLALACFMLGFGEALDAFVAPEIVNWNGIVVGALRPTGPLV